MTLFFYRLTEGSFKMDKDLKMEAFASYEEVKPVPLHVYTLHAQNVEKNRFSVIRGAVGKLKNYNHVGVFEDGENIYSTDRLNADIPNADFTIEYLGEKELPVLQNRKVYCDLIKYLITEKLRQVTIFDKYRKYSCKSSVTSKWIMTDKGFMRFESGNKEINLERRYSFWVSIMDNGKAYLRINTGSVFSSKLSVYDYMNKNINPIGMEVKNDWSYFSQTGTVTEVCDYTVTDKLDFADSLKTYYVVTKKEGYRVENLPDDTNVVKVKMKNNGLELPYYPQALKPVLTREQVGRIDAVFSNRIEPYVKRDMNTRLQLDIDFINDIGMLESINDLEFERRTCSVEELGFRKGTVPLPTLIGGNSYKMDCGNEYQVFGHGFYKKPDKQIKIGYIYPSGREELLKAVGNAIVSFAKFGRYHGEEDKYIAKGLMDIQSKAQAQESYEVGDITDYKRAANRLKKAEGIDIIIAIIPDGIDDDGPYNPFKTIWAKENIPSQMISLKTAEMFARSKTGDKTARYYLYNIVLGILGKTGGIPWIVKDMPGDADLFIGLDVATMAKGIHYPACSVVFDKYGRMLGFYKPSTPQQGEKITTKILQDIFDQVIFAYEDKFGTIPGNIVIHRDGFSNENDNWYKNYFESKGIKYSIIEVRKSIYFKLMLEEKGQIDNPTMGYCIYNNNKAYLVTTNITGRKGSPDPILIEKKCGDLKMSCILTQILYLSQLHVGSTHKMKLPITTGYADKICKNRDFVPEGRMDDRLFFL